MKKRTVRIPITLLCVMLTVCSGCGVAQEDYDKLDEQVSALESEVNSVKESAKTLESQLESQMESAKVLESQLDSAKKEAAAKASKAESVEAEYAAYKESMAEYEGLAAAEVESRRIEAEAIAKAEKEAAEKAKQESIAAKEKEEKAGYDTGITYDNLSRNPKDYEGRKVKFKGKVLQVIEGEGETQIRLAVNSDYDKVLFAGYDSTIVKSRVLEDDIITIYGTSIGLISYESTMGGQISIPGVYIDKIDQ